jgi:hypothetical protein
MKTLRLDFTELADRLAKLPEIEGLEAPENSNAPFKIRLSGCFGGRKLIAGCMPAADGGLHLFVPNLARIPLEAPFDQAIPQLLELNAVLSGSLELAPQGMLHYRLTQPGPRSGELVPDLMRLLAADLRLAVHVLYGILVTLVLPIDATTAKQLILPLAPLTNTASDSSGPPLPKMAI